MKNLRILSRVGLFGALLCGAATLYASNYYVFGEANALHVNGTGGIGGYTIPDPYFPTIVSETYSNPSAVLIAASAGVGFKIPLFFIFDSQYIGSNAIEITYNYIPQQKINGTRTETSSIEGSSLTQSNSYSYGISSQNLMLNYVLNFKPFYKSLAIFTEFGIGAAYIAFDNYAEISNPTMNADETTFNDSQKFSFAYQLGGGLRVLLTQHADVAFGYRYMNLGEIYSGKATWYDNGEETGINGIKPTLTTNLGGSQIFLRFAYHFA